MIALIICAIVFACVFSGALFGMFCASVVPEHHLTADSRAVINMAMGMMVTLSALVVGLLIASAKSSFDEKDSEMTRAAARLILFDRTMALYGPETQDIRNRVRQMVAMRISQIWPEENAGSIAPEAFAKGSAIEALQRRLLDLSPKNDAQQWLKSNALRTATEIGEARWLILEQAGTHIQWPFLAILIFWLAMIFASFGLVAPRNRTVIAVLLICALAVAGALYLIVQMDQPYSGLIKLSSAPLRATLSELGGQ